MPLMRSTRPCRMLTGLIKAARGGPMSVVHGRQARTSLRSACHLPPAVWYHTEKLCGATHPNNVVPYSPCSLYPLQCSRDEEMVPRKALIIEEVPLCVG